MCQIMQSDYPSTTNITVISEYMIIGTCWEEVRLTQRLKNSEDYTPTQLRILHLADLVNSLYKKEWDTEQEKKSKY